MMLGTKPVIFISYAHLDEPENPREGEVQWLSFVTGFLKPAETQGAVEIWTDRLMPGGADWSPEIEGKLRDCDIFILLISHNSLSSRYVVEKEIAAIRERQTRSKDVHFYPLLLTPTPAIALDIVKDKNRRPRGEKSPRRRSFRRRPRPARPPQRSRRPPTVDRAACRQCAGQTRPQRLGRRLEPPAD